MERFVYANIFGLIVVFAEYVTTLNNDRLCMGWCMLLAVLVLSLNILSLYDERAYKAKRTINTVSLFDKDFNQPKDKVYRYGL